MKRLPTLPKLPPKVRARVRAAEDRLRSRATGADVHPTVWVMRSAWIERGGSRIWTESRRWALRGSNPRPAD